MARVFEITTASDSARAKNGSADFVFNVKNTTARGLRGRARAVPLGNTKEQWLTVGGERERNISAGETHQIGVAITVPPDAPAGRYSFRLNVYSVENEEDFGDSPAVTAEVAPIPTKNGFDWRIIAAIAAVLVVGLGITLWALSGPKDKKEEPVAPVAGERLGPLEPRTNRQGSDFIPVFDAASAEACRGACEKDQRCAAMTFVQHSGRSDGDCWLKDHVPAPSPNLAMTSAALKTETPATRRLGPLEAETNRQGSDFKPGFPVNSAEDCWMACENDGACKAMTFVAHQGSPGGECWMKNVVPPPTPSSGMTSAAVP